MKSVVEWAAGNRSRVIQAALKTLPSEDEPWVVVLVNDFESHRERFRSESSFYYLTGLTEPGVVLCVYSDGRTILYRPNYTADRELWTGVRFSPQAVGFPHESFLGEKVPGYSLNPMFQPSYYQTIGKDLADFLCDKGTLFVVHDKNGNRYRVQSELVSALVDTFGISYREVRDISPVVHALRREKSMDEVTLMYDAAQITVAAHMFATKAIRSGIHEYELRGAVESVFMMLGCERPAFPTIVGAGINSTKLHYTQAASQLCDGDLVLIDCGVEYGMYSADITRTYPVSGLFTPRQKEVYELVLQVQQALERIVKPGMFLRNSQAPEASIQHIAVKMFKDAGVDQYFPHGVSHFLGLDTHDVGDTLVALAPGDAFTLEPGLYIPEERIGVRIEDDYVLTEDGLVCLSDTLPKEVDEIEELLLAAGEASS